jgi:hypothetical protein
MRFLNIPIILFASSSVKAWSNPLQQTCAIGIDKAPVIRGIKLGMTLSEVKSLYPSVSEPTERDEVGLSPIVIQGGDEKLKGINSLFLHFFRARVYYISARYDQNYSDEVAELTGPIGISTKEYARTECQGFTVSVFRPSDKKTVHLDLTDTSAQTKIIALQNELKENSADCQRPPEIRGIKLGMTTPQFQRLFPKAQLVRKRSDVGEVVFRSINSGDPNLKGIVSLLSYFLDGQLYFLVVDYDDRVKWTGLDQFVERFSEPLGLRTKWDGYFDERTLRCHSFIVKAEMPTGRPRITIQDRNAVSKLNKREEQLKSPANFRP